MRVLPGFQLVVEPSGPLLTTGIVRGDGSDGATWTTDRCSSGALVGFTGRAGLNVDNLVGQCSPLTLVVSAQQR